MAKRRKQPNTYTGTVKSCRSKGGKLTKKLGVATQTCCRKPLNMELLRLWGRTHDNRFGGETLEPQVGKTNSTESDAKLFGCSNNTLPPDGRQIIEAVGGKLNARQLTQCLTSNDGEKHALPLPARCSEKAPDNINCYGDGSLLHTKGGCWKIGGAGVWWPEREEAPNEAEQLYMKWEQHKDGRMAWANFTGLKGSSTRSEIASYMYSMLADKAVTMGTDSLSMLKKATRIAKHAILRSTRCLRKEDGTLNLGGTMSWLHRERPGERRWACTRDGDLWEHAQRMLLRRGPESIQTIKVKGHATEEMLEIGKVKAEDKKGNDKADEAAGRGSRDEQRRLFALTELYAERHEAYRMFMGKTQQKPG